MLTRRLPVTAPLVNGLVATVLGAMVLAGCGRAGAPQAGAVPGELHFAVQSAEPAPVVRQAWRPVIEDLRRRTGLKVTLRVYGPGEAIAGALRASTIDAGLLSNIAALEASRRASAEVFARIDPPDEAETRASVLIALTRRGLTLDRALKCRRSLTLAMGGGDSVADALAPMTYLFAPRGVDPKTCFKAVRVGAGARADRAAVAAGKVDLAVVGLPARDPAETGGVTELWRSPPLPQDPLLRRKALDPVVKEKLRQFFLTYGQGAGADAARARADLARLGIGAFKPADDSHLLPVREMEATSAWYVARRGGDKAAIAEAQARLDAITAERVTLEARTRAPAAAQ